jgi:hypothetical protein
MAWSTEKDVNKDVLEAINGGMRHAHFSCAIEFQREHVGKLGELHDRLQRLRYWAIAQANEPVANAAFRAQLLVLGVKSFLEMWVLLKEDKLAEAWLELVEAQQSLEVVQKILFDPDTENLQLHLLDVERTVFPPQTFQSGAYIFLEVFCSICNRPYGDCDHLQGKIYMGQICRRRVTKSELHEISFVLTPADKRCRIAYYAEDGKVYCTLTRRELPQSTPIDPEVKFAGGVFLYGD